jgi:hypothetical protein
VAVSLNFILRNDGPGSWKAYGQERLYIERSQGMLRYETDEDIAFLREHIAQGDYLPVECTGFAHTEKLDETMPEGKGRIDGFLSFEQAVQAGEEQLFLYARPFQYALDICYLHNKAGIKPYEKGVEKMAMDIALLASTVITQYLLPYVAVATREAAEVAYQKVGKEAATKFHEVAGKVWEKVSANFDTPKEQTALEFFMEDPEGLKSKVEQVLKQKLESNPQLAQELSLIIQKSEAQTANTGAHIGEAMYAAVMDFRNANFSGAQHLQFIGMRVEGNQGPVWRTKDEPRPEVEPRPEGGPATKTSDKFEDSGASRTTPS